MSNHEQCPIHDTTIQSLRNEIGKMISDRFTDVMDRMSNNQGKFFDRLEQRFMPMISDHEARMRSLEETDILRYMAQTERLLNDHEDRIRTMEKWQWKREGSLIVLAVLANLIVSLIVKHM